MESSNVKHEDKDNKGNINIPLATSSLEREMIGVYHCTNSGFASNGSNHS
jgi:hypothetical protein